MRTLLESSAEPGEVFGESHEGCYYKSIPQELLGGVLPCIWMLVRHAYPGYFQVTQVATVGASPFSPRMNPSLRTPIKPGRLRQLVHLHLHSTAIMRVWTQG